MIAHFNGKWACFSNFYPSIVMYEGVRYYTVEHAYQAAKTLDRELRLGMSQLHNPATAKRLGRLLPLREDWESAKVGVMRDLIALKFAPGSMFASQLLLSSPEDLVEGNTWHDRFWGRCTCIGCDGEGENVLGQLLMDRREQLWTLCAT
jgi:ribA/ribD-fused uncharacterized protein